MSCEVKININNKEEIFELDKVAKQASGAVLVREKDAVILATVARDDQMVEEDFLPLTVNYIEKSYAAAKIPGGYIKRETKPGDFETLTSRIIDRSLRPLFPKGYAYPTQIVLFVLSADPEVDLQTLALNGASAALYLSDIPVDKNVAGVRVARVDQHFVVNPTTSQLQESSLDLFVTGTKDELLMIEMRAIATHETEVILEPIMGENAAQSVMTTREMNELSDEETLEALQIAGDAIAEASAAYEEGFKALKKPEAELEFKSELSHDSIMDYIDEFYKEEINAAVREMAKSERASGLSKIAKTIALDETAQKEGWSSELISNMVGKYKKQVVRSMILDEQIRADGRGLKEVRDIVIETNILPSVHSSCLFTRGQTQALVALTLGDGKAAQMYDVLSDKDPHYENFMVHYNFPGFSVGEASPLRPPGRRELGHGNLAKRALEPSIDLPNNETIRLVSEILESNGSSSMATVCGGSLAMRAAGIESEKLVAGVAMGLVVEDDKYAVLTDIMGLEDHDGDMDFKVAGSCDGITALQMDIKLGGIDQQTLKEALLQASEARAHILDIMEKANSEIVLNENALPARSIFDLDPSTFGAIIGQAGATIKKIIEKFEVSVDLDKENGTVKVEGSNKVQVSAACDHIRELASQKRESRKPKKEQIQFDEGQVFDGEVKRIVDFGAFIELPGGVDGLLHISKLSEERVDKVTDILNIGDRVKVKILAQKGHKVELGLIEKL
ncbi:MAG: polyribonucleotide nucleotidyltransferase [Epsilonproteobacteria bacterium]|nr:polyribonucleotide nucleotidyltransferase [Campylobacterota bacterium]